MQNLEFVLQMHTALMALPSYEANDIAANSRKNPFGGMAETAETIRSDDRRKETKPSAHDHSSGTVLYSGTPSEN